MRIKRSSAKNFVILTLFSLLTVLFVLNEAAGASTKATEEWVAIYDGSASQYDDPAKTVVDSSGNVYVTGTSGNDFATVMYDKDGAEVWRARYSRSGASGDYPKAIAVDGDGNVYVAGNSSGIYGADYALVKYNSAGDEQWVQFYDGGGNHSVSGIALYVDGGSGQTFIHVTGYSQSGYSSSTTADYATIKYDADGTEVWVARFDAAGATDTAMALVVDGSGNVYVTGEARYTSPTSQKRYATVKYNSAGTQQWVKSFGGDGSSDHSARAIGFDSGGNVIVSGTTVTIKYNTAGAEQWVTPFQAYSLATDSLGNTYTTGAGTVKLDSSGAILWSDPFGGRDIRVDGDDDIYVTGFVVGDTSEDINNNDFKTVKFGSDGTALWTMQQDVEGHSDLARSMALYLDGTDSKTYVIVTGTSETDLTLNDYATIKYAALDGAEQWSTKFDGFASSLATVKDLDIDSGGNVYVTGSYHSSGSDTSYATIKYDPDGLELWVKSYDSDPAGRGTNRAQAIAVDAGGNVYVTGTVDDAVPGYFCGTIKYDTDGVFQWEALYTNAAHSEACMDIGLFDDSSDGQTYVYVAVADQTTDENAFAIIKYNSSGGEEWVRTYSFVGSDGYGNTPTSLAVDADGNVYLAGSSETASHNYAASVVAFDKNGVELWEGSGYSILNNDAQFDAITVDASGNVYLTGYAMYTYFVGSSQRDGYDLIAAKYDSSGTEQWVLRYGDTTTNAFGKAIAVDNSGNVYVGGNVPTAVYEYDYALIKLNASGGEQWARFFDGGKQDYDSVAAVAVDSAGTSYITGSSPGVGGYPKYTTIAYDSGGKQLWFERYDGSAQYAGDIPVAMAVSDDGNVYVTGRSYGTFSDEDYGTVKYSQALVTSDTVIPTVTAISPAIGETDVALRQKPSVTFSEAMDPLKVLDPAVFSVRDTLTGINLIGTISYDEVTWKLEYASYEFEYETMYTATLHEGATDLAGNPAASQSWSFTTVAPPDTTPPEFVSATPVDGSTGVSTTPVISATFNEPMSPYSFSNSWYNPDFGGGNDGTFQLVNNSTGLEVIPSSSELTSYDEATMTATLYLAAPLEFNTNYTATLIGSQIRDVSGNALGTDESWSFTTGSVGDTAAPFMDSVSPDVGAVNVAVDIVIITATFNETMDSDSFYTPEYQGLFTVTDTATGTPVNGWLNNIVGATATFYLGAPLTLGTEYLATIGGAVTDISGNPLGEDYTWTFNTGAGTPSDDATNPQVVSATPDGTTLVPTSVGLLTVTFNEPMDSATIVGVSDGTGTGAPFTVMVSGGAYITGTVTYDSGGMTARFVPDTNLSFDTLYLANMRGDVTDAAGNAMGSDYSWSFTSTPDPGTLGCDVDAGILDGCVNFDDFTYGTGVAINTYTIGTTGPVGEAALRKEVTMGKVYSHDPPHLTDNVESDASAYVDNTKMRLEARSRDINVTVERDGASAFAASKIDVTGVPPGALIPMTVTITRSALGDGYGAELQLHDFDHRPLGAIIIRKGFKQLTQMMDLYGASDDPANFATIPSIDSATMTFELLYPAIPNNGIVVYFATGAKKTSSTSGTVESDCTATIEFNPPPGVTVTMASGVAFTGELDSDGDGIGDSEDAEPYDATTATMDAVTGSGLIEVAIDSTSGSGATLSQVQSLDDSDISLNQTNKPYGYAFPDGLVSFQVMGLPTAGTAFVTVTFPTIPAGAKYYKVGPDGFYEFGGAVFSGNTVTLTLVDGDAGDHDGVANGVIVDPGGVGVPQDCVTEIWYDGINQSCKTGSDYDQDGDGFDLEVDCDDTDVTINFGATEIWYDGINQSCKDGSDYDQDGDGHDSSGHGGDDCDDTDPLVTDSCIFKNGFE